MNAERWRELRDELEQEANRLQGRLDKIRRVQLDLNGLIEGDQEPAGGKSNGTHPRAAVPRSNPLNQIEEGETRYARIAKILKPAEKPLSTSSIVNQLIQLGDKLAEGSTGRFYNTVDAALRIGEKNGWFNRPNRGLWELGDVEVGKKQE